tara:strand:- start:3015 stop:3593 length:579 start_codon:yes stop_codon:yes gene_type:complete
MDYAEISDSEDYYNDEIETLISKLKISFDFDGNHQNVEIDTDSEYVRALTDLKSEYKNEMVKLMKNTKMFNDFQEKFEHIEVSVRGLLHEKYAVKLTEIVQEFRDSHNITEIKENIKNSEIKILKLKKELSLTHDCGVGNQYICFICLDRGVDTLLNPCGHVICSTCMQHQNPQSCPYCRGTIQSSKKFFLG